MNKEETARQKLF